MAKQKAIDIELRKLLPMEADELIIIMGSYGSGWELVGIFKDHVKAGQAVRKAGPLSVKVIVTRPGTAFDEITSPGEEFMQPTKGMW